MNTVVFACGTTIGYNTDWLGVRKPLVPMKGAKAVLLGAGGVAAGAAYALTDLDMDVTILNRTPENAKKLAERFGCGWGSSGTNSTGSTGACGKCHTAWHATGYPKSFKNRSAASRYDRVRSGVYPPGNTTDRSRTGTRVPDYITGVEMFIEQAREQCYMFFGIDVPVGESEGTGTMIRLAEISGLPVLVRVTAQPVGVIIDGCPLG